MISEELFTKCIDALKKQYDFEKECYEVFRTTFFVPGDWDETMIEVLSEIFRDDDDWIDYFVYELNFGREWKPGVVKVDGTDVRLADTKDLYNLLMDCMIVNIEKRHPEVFYPDGTIRPEWEEPGE